MPFKVDPTRADRVIRLFSREVAEGASWTRAVTLARLAAPGTEIPLTTGARLLKLDARAFLVEGRASDLRRVYIAAQLAAIKSYPSDSPMSVAD